MTERKGILGLAAIAAVLVASVVVLAIAFGGNGGSADGGSEGAGAQIPRAGGDASHIHGLGVDPARGDLLVATHAGLFRASDGSTSAQRVGASDRDLMGFSVVGPGHFVASGHPGSEADLPANLGLVESRDGGRTWRSVSLRGQADFHVLRVAGRRVYGFDGTLGRFMVSRDLGRTWTERDVAAVPFDLAIDPSEPDHVLAATDDGLRRSRDAGRTWRAVSEDIALLAWEAPRRLFLLRADGALHLSTDGGRTSRPRGQVDGQPVGLLAAGGRVFVARADGSVVASDDGGRSFSVRARL